MYLTLMGALIYNEGTSRFMGADLAHLKEIPTKVVASGGIQKVPIIKAVLRAGYANILVTDEVSSRAVYDSESNSPK